MTENRLFAALLRLLAGLVAIAGILGLSACGGGSGAPNNVFDFKATLGSSDIVPQVVTTLTVTGGTLPYRVTTSNPSVLSISPTSATGVYNLLAVNVGTDTTEVITVQDNTNKTLTLNATIHPLQQALGLNPPTSSAFAGFPLTLSINGGTGPYTAFTDNNLALSVASVVGNTVTLVPGSVSSNTSVVVTVRDALGATSTSAITVMPAALVNSMTLKADNFNTIQCPNDRQGVNDPTDSRGSTWICSGQTGTVGVKIQNPIGGGLSGRQVRFDVVQGDFQIFNNAPGAPESFVLSFTVPTDQNGNAVVRVRANPDAHQQVAIVQATDLATGNFVRSAYVISQLILAADSQFTIIPSAVNFTGPDTLTCAEGSSNTFFIYGGQPPYIVQNSSPQYFDVEPTVVTQIGGGFTATTLGGCIDNGTISVTDALGHTAVATVTNKKGTIVPADVITAIPITISPSTVPFLSCGASTNVTVLGGGTVTVAADGKQTFNRPTNLFVTVLNPAILTATPTNPAPGTGVTLNRTNSGAQPGGSVTMTISDGTQSITVSVPVATICP